jgi:hypothetical protein
VGVGGGVSLIFFLHILSSLVNIRLHTENWLCNSQGSALTVPVGVVVVGGGWLESKLSDQLWLSFSLALAKLNNLPSTTHTNFSPRKGCPRVLQFCIWF